MMKEQKIITIQGINMDEFLDKVDERHEQSLKKFFENRSTVQNSKELKNKVDLDAFFTKEEVAELFRVSLQTITARMRNGKLKYRKFGRRVLFRKTYIRDLMKDDGLWSGPKRGLS